MRIHKLAIALPMLYTHMNTTNIDFVKTNKPKISKDFNALSPMPITKGIHYMFNRN
jgi:hypothetical protein